MNRAHTIAAAPRQILPRPGALPIVGALPHLIRDPFGFLLRARETYGDMYVLDLGLTKFIAYNHPDHAQQILIENAGNYRKGGAMWDAIRTLLGNGLPVSEGTFWRRQRRLMQPQFHRKHLGALVDRMSQVIAGEVSTWEGHREPGGGLDVAKLLTSVTMKVIVSTMFGTALTPEEADRAAAHFTYALDHIVVRMVTSPLPGWLPIPGTRRYSASVRSIDDLILRVVERRRRGDSESVDLLSLLMDAVDADTGEQMTAQELRDEAVSIFVAGFETTSSAMAWALYYLTRYPAIVENARAVVDQVLGDSRSTFATLGQLGYLRMVMQETLRLHPSAFWIPRTPITDDVIGGHTIPAGSTAAIVSYAIHHHPEFWARPYAFDPERFTPERSANRHKMAYLAFGAGQRVCIGKELGLIIGQLVLAQVLQTYDIRAIPGKTPRMQLSTTTRPKGGVWLNLTRRRPAGRNLGRP